MELKKLSIKKQSQSQTRDNEVRQHPPLLVLKMHIELAILIIFRSKVIFKKKIIWPCAILILNKVNCNYQLLRAE